MGDPYSEAAPCGQFVYFGARRRSSDVPQCARGDGHHSNRKDNKTCIGNEPTLHSHLAGGGVTKMPCSRYEPAFHGHSRLTIASVEFPSGLEGNCRYCGGLSSCSADRYRPVSQYRAGRTGPALRCGDPSTQHRRGHLLRAQRLSDGLDFRTVCQGHQDRRSFHAGAHPADLADVRADDDCHMPETGLGIREDG